MINISKRIKFVAMGIVLASVPLLSGCGDNIITWQEDVKLLDGRVITVTQKRRIEQGKMPREAWLTFKLPEFSDQEIVWHENLETQVLNVYQGRLYVVGVPFTEESYKQYGKPYPEYVPFRYEAGHWQRIGFNEVPKAIYDTNMYFENMALYRLKHVSLADKDKMLKDDSYIPAQKRMTSTFKTPH
jgi:hypothetical protein